MPPMYSHECTKCKKSVDILRDFDKYKDSPNAEEGGTSCPVDGGHEWEKIIHVPLIVHAPGFGKKGHWILAFTILTAGFCELLRQVC